MPWTLGELGDSRGFARCPIREACPCWGSEPRFWGELVVQGMGAPLATVAAFNAVLFSTWGALERLLGHADGEAWQVLISPGL